MAKPDSSKMISTAEERLIALSALLNYGRIINIQDKDIEELYQKIEKINELQTDEDMQLACDYDLDKIKSVDDLRQRIQEQKSKLGTKLFEQYGVDKVKTAVYDSLRSTSYGNGKDPKKQTGLSEKTAQYFADIIGLKKLEDPFVPDKGKAEPQQTYADKLAEIISYNYNALVERMRYDFEGYKKRVKNPAVEEVVSDIYYFTSERSEISFHFITGKSEKKACPGDEARAVAEFNEAKRKRREKIRGPFSDEARPNFVKLLATMQNIGFNHCDNNLKSMNETDINHSFTEIENIVGKIYGADKEKVLQGMFGKNYTQHKDEAINKCVDLYGKLYAACLSEKITKEWTAKDGTPEIPEGGAKDFTRNISAFINNALTSGKLNPFKIFECPTEETKGDETNLTASVHHNFTVGAIEDACGKMAEYGVKDTSIEACSEAVNNLGLFTEIIGKEVHGSLEPNYDIILGAENNGKMPRNMIFAGSADGIDAKVLEKLGFKKDSNLYKMIMQNVNQKDKEGRIFSYMELPEGKVISKIREDCRKKDAQKTQRNILDLAKIVIGKDKN